MQLDSTARAMLLGSYTSSGRWSKRHGLALYNGFISAEAAG